jgi:hypothetical protein
LVQNSTLLRRENCFAKRAGELAGAEQRLLKIAAQTSAVEIGGEVFLEVMVAWHRVPLPALFAQPDAKPAILRVAVLDRPAKRGADAGEENRPSARCAPDRATVIL